MRYTLLEMVKRVLASMESDEVQSIGETQESTDVAEIIRGCYFDIIGSYDFEEDHGIFGLDASQDNLKPTVMYLPKTVQKFDYIKYNISDDQSQPNWREIEQIPFEEFLVRQPGMDLSYNDTGTSTVHVNNKDLVIRFRKDRMPSYYTMLNDYTFLFDAFDAGKESTLSESRSLSYGTMIPEFKFEDDFVPRLDPRQFQFLINDAINVAFVELKQTENPVAARKARRQSIRARKTRNDNGGETRQPRYTYGRYSVRSNRRKS